MSGWAAWLALMERIAPISGMQQNGISNTNATFRYKFVFLERTVKNATMCKMKSIFGFFRNGAKVFRLAAHGEYQENAEEMRQFS